MYMEQTEALFKEILKVLEPPQKLQLSEWADEYRIIPAGTSSESGKWRTSRTPYLEKIMNSITDAKVRKVIIMSSAQVGKSEIILNTMGYYMHIDPSSILLVQPTVQTAEEFSKKRIKPTIKNATVLSNLFKGSESSDNILNKTFAGGFLTCVGANSPSGLSSNPIKILLCDEIDRWGQSAGSEGDPLALAEARTTTFPHTHKKVFVSTPTIDKLSRIQKEYLLGSQESWTLPCPACGEYQKIEWSMIHFKAENKKLLDDEILCCCNYCGELNNERTWKKGAGRWNAKNENETIKSFHLNVFVSPWATWKDTVISFLEKKDEPEMLKVWTNTELGEVWLLEGDTVDHNSLISRCEYYGQLVPDEVAVITCGVDVQDNRFELEVVGWGVGKQSYGIEYIVLYGDTSLPENWNRLDEQLKKIYAYGDNKQMGISCVCIDSGGHRTDEVYRFTKIREMRKIYSIKGRGGYGLSSIHSFTKTKKVKNTLFILGVDTIKESIYSRLLIEDELEAGYCHFPSEEQRGYNEKYFEGITGEVRKTKFVKGRAKFEWHKKAGVNNEPLDCRVYATAALEILNPNLELLLQQKNGVRKSKRKKRGTLGKGVEV